ncbi:MAG TPA: HAD family phosphatase [Aggregatilineales bacterium]|nr:HAD family phosphatase [Aggregatilineales bacterium]
MDQLNNPKPAVVFDFGGVLMDWNPRYLYRKLFNGDSQAVERFLTEIGFEEWNLRQDAGYPIANAIAELSAKFPHLAHLIQAYDERWDETIAGSIQPTVEILHSLKQAGYPLYGLTNWSAETFSRVRHQYSFFDWFLDIVVSGEEKVVKPDPRLFAILLKRIGRPANECLLIDDSLPNVTGAAQLGIMTIRFESPEQLAAELSRRHLLPNGARLPTAL